MTTVWQHSAVQVRPVDVDCFGVYTSVDLERHELILIERVETGTHEELSEFLSQQPVLFKSLYPRLCAESDAVDRKLYSNCFLSSTVGYLHLGATSCFFNHRCVANVLNFTETQEGVTYLCFVTLSRIQAEEQLLISYGNGAGHDNDDYCDFACDCPGVQQEDARGAAEAAYTAVAAQVSRNIKVFRNV